MAVGVIVEKAAYKPVREKGNSMTALITAIAMSLLLENGSQAIFGADFQTVPTIFHLPSIAFGKLKLPGDTLLTIVIGLVIMVGLQLFVKFTRQGKAMRAVSEDKEAAVLMGINVNSTIALTFAIGSGLAAVASLMYCAAYPQVSPMMGAMLGLKAFVAAEVLGGSTGSIPGAVTRWSGHRSDRKPDQGVYRHHHGGHHHLGVLRRHRVRHPDHRAARQTVRHYGQERRGEGLHQMKKTMLSTKQSYLVCFIGVLAPRSGVVDWRLVRIRLGRLLHQGHHDDRVHRHHHDHLPEPHHRRARPADAGMLRFRGHRRLRGRTDLPKYMVAAGIAIDPAARFTCSPR